MTYFQMYLFTRLDSLNCMFMLITTISLFIAVFWGLFAITDGEFKSYKKYARYIVPLAVVSGILLVLVPTQKEAAAIYIVPKIMNNEQVNHMAVDTLSILERETAGYLLELVKEDE